MAENTKNPENAARPEFRMQKMFIKDFSFENPNAPEVYITPQKSEPKVELNLNLNHTSLDNDHYEVTLKIYAKVATKDDEKTLFILEIEHSGIFLIRNVPQEHIEMVLGVDCPTLLFPFTRQIVSQVTVDGGFSPFLMEPVNFMALFQNAKAKKEANN
ncbi:protein-export chaperone SecB [Desulfopila aestuarii]|uniref:Protein translocase subunit secB n=1 Tax=Desulfopila aestuarii DSM 18488 TaxID=1121416 RepID=A0A1M7YH51_9BACT|nr:protein-export chaperone SecB [Desulfopila aestuarii]SHO51962.1 protein translocase subunit secB [Desulfopila aestuarii DSM 18488]